MLRQGDIVAAACCMADAAKASQGVLRGGEDDSDDFTQVMVSSGELLAVSAHEELSHCTVLEGGEMRIEGGATVSSLLVQAGAALWVASGCSVSDMHLEAGAVVNGFTLRRNANPSDFGNGANGLALGNVNVESGATAFLEGGQSVDTCHVLSGGVLELRDGASVGISLIVSKGGMLNGFTAGETIRHYAGGAEELLFSSYEVRDGDTARCLAGQRAIDCTVLEGGVLELSGRLLAEDGADICDNGVNIRMDLLGKANSTAFMSLGEFTPGAFTVTVDDFQTEGTYLLADGLADIDYSCGVELVFTEGSMAEHLSLEAEGSTAKHAYGTYSLSLDGGLLSLTVSQNYPETYPVIMAYQADGGLFVDCTDGCKVTKTQFRVSETDGWSDYSIQPEIPTGATNLFLRCQNITGRSNELSYIIKEYKDGQVAPVGVSFGPEGRGMLMTLKDEGSEFGFSVEGNRVSVYSRKDVVLGAADADGNDFLGEGLEVAALSDSEGPMVFASEYDVNVFVAKTDGKWNGAYAACHSGFLKDGEALSATGEIATITGRNRITDIFSGADGAATILLLTDADNGDALFIDDVYSDSPDDAGKTQSRLADITAIYAGAGDDVIDLTSDRFAYTGDGVSVHGGEGDDVIWSNIGDNWLFGDAGDDRIVGGCGDDVLVGGEGDDILDGNGGEDVFCFGEGWGNDEVRQSSNGKVVLWFAEGIDNGWQNDTRKFTFNGSTVAVKGDAAVEIRLGGDSEGMYGRLCAVGAFG